MTSGQPIVSIISYYQRQPVFIDYLLPSCSHDSPGVIEEVVVSPGVSIVVVPSDRGMIPQLVAYPVVLSVEQSVYSCQSRHFSHPHVT